MAHCPSSLVPRVQWVCHVDLNQLHLEVGQILVIEGELALEGVIRGPALPLQEIDDAGEHGIDAITVPPPAPARPPPVVARRSCPWRGVQVARRAQLRTRLLPLATPGIKRAQAAATVGLERAHAECVGQGEGLLVVGYGGLALQGIAPHRNVAEEA